jgi:hypothetical protein
MVENLLVLGGSFVALIDFDESLSAKICGPIASNPAPRAYALQGSKAARA